jgi:hypothetical protein
VIQTCTDVGEGCLQWQDGTDCADTSETCDDAGGTAECVAGCTPDCSTEDATQCNVNDIETCTDVGGGCLQWQETTDCTTTGQVCDDASGTPTCVTPCVPDCATAAATQCDGTVIDTCTDVGGGCLQWVAGTDCAVASDYCDATSGTATCMTCTDGCTTAGATQCNATVIETCTADARGCLGWVAGIDCSATSQVCDATSGTAICEEPMGSGSCASPIVVRTDHFALAGTDFTADFTDDQTFGDASCDSRTGTVDAVFSIALAAGETVLLRELGTLDAVLSLQNTCGDAAVCVFAEDFSETVGWDYTATVAETVYLIVEAWYATPVSTGYDIRIDIVAPEDCGNGVDDDIDGDIDCDDSDCFGDATDCATETNCTDAADNDGDTTIDCADSDCGTVPACAPYRAVFEAFAPAADAFDLGGSVLTFTPSTTAAMGYTWAVADGTGAYVVTPGSGTVTAALTLTDDSNREHVFSTLAAGFPFYGTTYTRVFVGSNGHLTFGSGNSGILDSQTELFTLPTIAALTEDLNPAAAGAGPVTVDEFADRVAVTFHNVPFYAETPLNQFQIVLFADGRIQLVWLVVPAAGFDSGDTPYVGIASGIGAAPYPAETNFYTPPVELCGNGTDDDRDSLIDCSDPDCFGNATYCATETNCGDAADNDGDTTIDCADSDCTFAAACSPRINEVRYDQSGTDTEEFVELYAPASLSLTGYTLVHVNGATGAPTIWAADLTGRTVGTDRFWVLGSSVMTGLTEAVWADFGVGDTNAMQNDQEALVLYWHRGLADERIVDAVAWEGPASLPATAIEGTPATGIPTAAWNNTMGRYADGNDTNNNLADFVQSWWPTPGAANTPAQPAGFSRVSASSGATSGLPAAIPDNLPAGISLTLASGAFLGTSIAEIHVGVRIRHTFRGDLIVGVANPAGTAVQLHNRSGGGADDLMTVYSLATAPDQPLTPFVGTNPTGTWTLTVSDNAGGDTGSVLEWVVWVRNP